MVSDVEFIIQIHMVEAAKKDDESTDTDESVDLPVNRNATTLIALITMENEIDIDECDTKIVGKLSITVKISCNIYCQ